MDNINSENNITQYTIQLSKKKECFEEKDSDTALFIKKYCGNIIYEYKKKENKPLSITLPENDKFYGAYALYCEYSINNYDEIKSLTIQTIKKWGTLYMKIEYFDEKEDTEFILDNEDKYIINKPKSINIIFYSNDKKESSPFSVKISNTLIPKNIVIISIIIICSFILVIIIIFLIIYLKKLKKDRARTIIINNNRNYIIGINKGEFTTERNELLTYLLRHFKKEKFKEIKEKSLNNCCPIEMTPFDDNSDVIFTSCHHTIHYSCLKEHATKNIHLKEVKCFLCNNILYKYDSNLNSFININSQNPF